ncbi:SusC/RagA family TonB-linked outer membrane protein [Bacteroidia bacterium]|nr:SusC/RagA family TonB-linked outer membrane protein [Bacteroidia bacterium]
MYGKTPTLTFTENLGKMIRVITLHVAVFFCFFSAVAQNSGKIAGKITDEKTGESIVGVSLSIVQEKTGTVSDAEGYFSLNIQSLPATLSVDYLGYQHKEIKISQSTESLSILLSENTQLLNEVVVVGYGTQRRKELTGSVASVSKDLLNQKVTFLDGILSGAVAGLNVTQTSGQPGAGSSIRIRGGNSIYASNEPLYVIDGFIYFNEKGATQTGTSNIDGSLNPLSSINPSDIESVEILKDVSAKAIYGSRGANGVILITTKKGKRNGNIVHYQYTVGADKSAKKLDLLSARQWLDIQKTYFNDKPSLHYSPEELARFYKGTNWQDAVLQTGLSQTHELSVSGGDDKTRYLISGNYTDQRGIVLHSGFNRFSGRLNLEKDLFSSLRIGVTSSANRSVQNALTTFEYTAYRSSPFSNGISNSLVYALYMPPVLPVYDSSGNYNYKNPFEYNYLSYQDHSANPVSDLKNSIGQTIVTSLQGNFYAQYTIIEGLKAKISAGANIDYITQNLFLPPYTALGMNQDIKGKGAIGSKRLDVKQTEYLLTYTKQLNPAHYIDVLTGYTWQNTTSDVVLSQAIRLDSFDNLGMGKEQLPISRHQDASFHSVLGRINYTLLDRYNLTATYRADKSSRFAKGHQWGYFPSVGLSWNVDKENFFRNVAENRLSTLKLRLTYGEAGNQNIDFNEYDLYFSAGRYNGETASQLTTLDNPDLKWETTAEYNAGIDAGFWNDRLTLVADVYYKKTRDLLLKVPPPFASGATQLQMTNIGNVTNKGLELAVNAKVLDRRDLSVSVSANFARNINTITHLGKYADLKLGYEEETILRTGESVGSFYGYEFDGIVQTGETSLPTVEGKVPKPGDVKLRNLNDDNKVTQANDRTVLGSIQPDFIYGFSSTVNYKQFDLQVVFSGSYGNEVYNLLRRYLERTSDAYNMSTTVLNAWTEENPSNIVPHINSPRITLPDSRYIEDASFLKLRNLTVGYSISAIRVNNEYSLNFRVFASARNLYTWTKYRGYDPEVADGVDLGVYPTARSFLLGASLTF